MKWWPKIALTVLVALVVFSVMPALPVSAAALPDSTPTIETKKCYRNLLEPGDFLIVWEQNIPYAVPPSDPITEVFLWEFIDTDGVTVLGTWSGWAYEDDGYNYQCGSMYFDAAAGLVWDPVGGYTLRLRGNPLAFASPPVYDYPITSDEYSTMVLTADVQEELALDVLLIAQDLDLQWGLTASLINDDETGQTLSIFGQAYFRGAIYGIQALAPSLFPLAVTTIDLTDRTWTDAYVATLETQYAGTWVETAKAAGATLFGVADDMVSIIMLVIFVAGAFIGNIMVTNDSWNGAVDVAVVLIVMAKLSVYGLGYLGLIAAVCWIYAGMRLFKFPH